MRVLHLEDDPNDALLVQRTLERAGLSAEITNINSAPEFRDAVSSGAYDAIVVDNGVPGFNAKAALEYSRRQNIDIPVIVCSGSSDPQEIGARLREGAVDYVLKDHLWQLAATLQRLGDRKQQRHDVTRVERHNLAMRRLVDLAQELSMARDLASIKEIVCRGVRDLTRADGAAFVLREGGKCFYADENAISPLWKGQRFAMEASVSGWAMLHRQSVAIDDVYADPRAPVEAYRSTFVKSLALAPIRTSDPIGAIGAYWANRHAPTPDEMNLLESLANATAVAIDNVQLYRSLEQRVQQGTQELEAANRELEAFSYAVSHDLRAPLRGVSTQLAVLAEDHAAQLDGGALQCVARAQTHAHRMSSLIDDLLRLSRINQSALHLGAINLSDMVTETVDRLRAQFPDRKAHVSIEQGIHIVADHGLLAAAIENLVTNAWKYTRTRLIALIEFGTVPQSAKDLCFYIRDNGVGFDMQYADKLFQPFQRMHSAAEFPGSGVGLATVRRIIERHGGQIWAEAAENEGATFYFTLKTR